MLELHQVGNCYEFWLRNVTAMSSSLAVPDDAFFFSLSSSIVWSEVQSLISSLLSAFVTSSNHCDCEVPIVKFPLHMVLYLNNVEVPCNDFQRRWSTAKTHLYSVIRKSREISTLLYKNSPSISMLQSVKVGKPPWVHRNRLTYLADCLLLPAWHIFYCKIDQSGISFLTDCETK